MLINEDMLMNEISDFDVIKKLSHDIQIFITTEELRTTFIARHYR